MGEKGEEEGLPHCQLPVTGQEQEGSDSMVTSEPVERRGTCITSLWSSDEVDEHDEGESQRSDTGEATYSERSGVLGSAGSAGDDPRA